MHLRILLAICGLILLPSAASAQSVPSLANVVTTCGTPPSTYSAGQNRPVLQNTSGQVCTVTAGGGGGGVPVTPAAITPVAGTQRGLSIASSTALTVPGGATLAVIQAQGSNNSSGICLYWQDDGTAPTNSAGQGMSAVQTLVYKGSLSAIRLIAASGATCTATISYYQ